MSEKAKQTKNPIAADVAAKSVAKAAVTEQAPGKLAAKAASKKPAKATAARTSKPTKEKLAKAVKAVKPTKPPKPRKIKMVSDRFSMPTNEYARLAEFKKICLKAGVPVKKSELLRAGLLSLSKLSDIELIAAAAQVDQLKAQKPAKT